MTRRERILTAMDGGVPDRPPISFDAPGKALDDVLAYYGAADKNDLYRIAGIDGFSVWEWNAVEGRYTKETEVLEDGEALDFWGNSSQHHCGLAHCGSIGDLQDHPWPQLQDFDFSHVKAKAEWIRDQDMVVSAGHLGVGYQMHNMLRGNENALYDVCDPDYMAVYMEKVTEFTVAYADALLQSADGLIEVFRADDDVGTMDRLMISPDMWRTYYKPAWKAVIDVVHRHGAKIWFHSCGYIEPLREDLFEVGVDCWNPFPPNVKGNDHPALADWRRGRLVLDGGVDQILMVQGTAEQVREATEKVLDLFAPDGGLLIGPSQVLTEDMPLGNKIAFFETAVKYGG